MKILIRLTAVVGLLAVTGVASAHTTSIGFVPGASAGEVTFYTGSYRHGGTPSNEGTLSLSGALGTSYGPVTTAFNITPVSTKPAGLVNGTNNFFWQLPAFQGPLDTSATSSPSGYGGGEVWWQGVTFAGLNPGTYNFSCGATCGSTVQWNSWGQVGNGTLNITGQQIGGGGTGGSVPEPSALALMGIGLFGAGMVRRRKRKLAASK